MVIGAAGKMFTFQPQTPKFKPVKFTGSLWFSTQFKHLRKTPDKKKKKKK